MSKEENRETIKSEKQNKSENAENSGANNDDNKSLRNSTSYESEFGSRKAGPSGYGDRYKARLDAEVKNKEKKQDK